MDIREKIKDLFIKARKTVKSEKERVIEATEMIGRLDAANAAVNLGFFSMPEYIKALGLSQKQYYTRVAACRVIRFHPELRDLWVAGETELSILAQLGNKISQANADRVIAGIRGKSKREAEFFLSTIDLGGNITDRQPTSKLMIEVTEAEMAQIERLRDILSAGGKNLTHKEALMKAAEDCLEKRDPMRQAARAARRLEKKSLDRKPDAGKAEGRFPPGRNPESRDTVSRKTVSEQPPTAFGTGDKASELTFVPDVVPDVEVPDKSRKPIPSQIKHKVWLRDQGQCTFMGAGETRCSETRMLEIDHVVPFAWLGESRSGDSEPDNLRLLCRFHNQAEAMRLMGQDTVLRHHASHHAVRPN